MSLTDEVRPPSVPSSSDNSSADTAQEEKEGMTASTEQQPEPDWLHIPLTSDGRSFDGAEQLFTVS